MIRNDIKVKNPNGDLQYLYFRVSDHPEDPYMSNARESYHQKLTRKYEQLPDSAVVDNMYLYTSIVVNGKRFDRFDAAMTKVKQDIDQVLKENNLL